MIRPKFVTGYNSVLTYQIQGNQKGSENIKLAIVIPTFNEEKNLRELLPKLKEETDCRMPQVTAREIFVIDDRSTDGTVEYARSMGAVVPYCFERRGLGQSYAEGVAMAVYEHNCDIVVTMDGDHPAGHVKKMLGKLISDNLDIVVGYEFESRTSTSKGAGWLAKKFLGLGFLEQPTCGFIAMRADLVHRLQLRKIVSKGDFWHVELLFFAKSRRAKFGQLEFSGHKHGSSSFTRVINWLNDMLILGLRRCWGVS